MDLRKNLIIIIFLLTNLLLALLFLNLNKSWKRQSAQIAESRINASASSPKKISKGAVRFFDLVRSDKVIFYDEFDLMIYETSFDGRGKKELARIPNASEIIFGPGGKNLIATISQNKEAKKFYFDLENNKRIELNPRMGRVAFSPSGNQITYHFYDEDSGQGNISVSNPDGSAFKIIFKTRIKDLEIFWPETDSIIFYSKKDPGFVFSVSPETGRPQKLPDSFMTVKFFNEKSGPLNDYTVFINPEDGKLYTLLK